MARQHRRPAPGLMHHRDQGCQYRASLYQTLLARRRVVVSMSCKGNCYDNAPVESFFSSLKNELVRHRQFQNQAEAQMPSKTTSTGSVTGSGYIRHSAIGVQRKSNGKSRVFNSRVYFLGPPQCDPYFGLGLARCSTRGHRVRRFTTARMR